MNVTQNFDKTNNPLRDNSRLSGKSGTKTGQTSKGVITPSAREKQLAYLDSPEAQTQQYQAESGIGGSRKASRGGPVYQDGMMKIPKDMKESPMKKGKQSTQNRQQNQQNGKIILKKINHFFDNNKIDKLYKNDFRKMNQ